MGTSSKMQDIRDTTEQLKNAALDVAKTASNRVHKSSTNEKLAAGAVALGVVAGAAVAAYKANKSPKTGRPKAKSSPA